MGDLRKFVGHLARNVPLGGAVSACQREEFLAPDRHELDLVLLAAVGQGVCEVAIALLLLAAHMLDSDKERAGLPDSIVNGPFKFRSFRRGFAHADVYQASRTFGKRVREATNRRSKTKDADDYSSGSHVGMNCTSS